jgi:hypothetical protein
VPVFCAGESGEDGRPTASQLRITAVGVLSEALVVVTTMSMPRSGKIAVHACMYLVPGANIPCQHFGVVERNHRDTN